MWFSLSHFFPDGVRHHTKKTTHGVVIADNTKIASIILFPFLFCLGG